MNSVTGEGTYELDKEYKTVYVQPRKTVEIECQLDERWANKPYGTDNIGGWYSKSGSYHALIPSTAKAWGLNVEGCTTSKPQRILDALSDGKLAVAIMTEGHFTSSGHFIVLRGVQDGQIRVADLASYKRGEKLWDLSIILNKASKRAGMISNLRKRTFSEIFTSPPLLESVAYITNSC